MALLKRKPSFCTICKKNISKGNKPDKKWNIEGLLCLECYMIEMKKQYGIKDEVANDSKKIQTNSPGKSTKMIRYQYYWAIFAFIFGPIFIIWGFVSEATFTWMIGIVVLVIAVIQYPKYKKQFEAISKTDNEPLTILKMRLVKGEITTEEFENLRKKLE